MGQHLDTDRIGLPDVDWPDALHACVEACLKCAQLCMSCADATLTDVRSGDVRRCIGLSWTCGDICVTTARVLSRPAALDAATTAALLDACISACRRCADECSRHAGAELHFSVCAAGCEECASACRRLAATFA